MKTNRRPVAIAVTVLVAALAAATITLFEGPGPTSSRTALRVVCYDTTVAGQPLPRICVPEPDSGVISS